METFYQLLGVIGAGLIVWLLYRTIKSKADVFNKAAMSKSFFTMGVLALGLIIFVCFLIVMVRTA